MLRMVWNILICVTSSWSLVDQWHVIHNMNLIAPSEETHGWPSFLLPHEVPFLALIREGSGYERKVF